LIYYAAFIPGLQNVIEKAVRERLSNVVIHKLLDGAVIFETGCAYDALNFFCFNNIFAVIDIREAARFKGDAGLSFLEAHMRAALGGGLTDGERRVISENNKKITAFRIVTSVENKIVRVDERLRRKTERAVAAVSNLKPDRRGAGTEFWFLYRRVKGLSGPERPGGAARTDFSVFMKRLTLRRSWDKTLHPGELPPPLAWVLCYLAELKHNENAADPFCGYGAVPFAALKHFHLNHFFASDVSGGAVKFTLKKLQTLKKNCFSVKTADFFAPAPGEKQDAAPGEGGLDAIITDPPWGLYEKNAKSPGEFYYCLLEGFAKLLKKGGRAVILTAQQEELKTALAKQGCFKTTKTIPILLSGKKAGIFRIEKTLN
jgi:hypothetical protein